jgi:hypothetical protein
MKVVTIPVRVYETGDIIKTSDGRMQVVYDELEGVEEDILKLGPDKVADLCIYRNGITVRYLEETCNHQVGDEVVIDRDHIILEEGTNESKN